MLTAIRRWLCGHRCSLGELRRISPVLVECACQRCGKVLRAEYGLALPVRRWVA